MPVVAIKRGRNNINNLEDIRQKRLKPRPEFGLECLNCSEFGHQRALRKGWCVASREDCREGLRPSHKIEEEKEAREMGRVPQRTRLELLTSDNAPRVL